MEKNKWIEEIGYEFFLNVSMGIILKNYNKFIYKRLVETRVTPGEYPFVMLLYRKGSMIQCDLADYFMVSDANITKTLNNLENKGILERVVDLNNKRKKIVSLTNIGLNFCEEMISIQQEWDQEVRSSFTEDELKSFGNILYRMLDNTLNLE